jgi:alginate O-acetyltransferase complex protein AlgJ
MSEVKKVKLSREEIAKREIGVTEVSKAQKLFLSIFFLFVIGVYPCIQFVYSSPLKEIRPAPTAQKAFKQYETAIEDTSLLRAVLLTPAQEFLTKCFRTGNEKVIVGSDGWLFYSGDYDYLVNPGFMQAGRMHKRDLAGAHPDAVAAIRKFADDLKARGIRLILIPAPGKPLVYGDKLGAGEDRKGNKSFDEFKKQVESFGVTVLDFTDDFIAMRKDGVESYLKTDTHWTPTAMQLAAKKTAEAIGDAEPDTEAGAKATITARGDIANMLKLPDVDDIFPKQTVEVVQYDVVQDRNSDVLLLGDSFTNIFSLDAMGWGTRAGFAETLAHELGRPIDVIARNDAGAHATRDVLSAEFLRGRNRLEGKKVVVWEFAIRELAVGDWTDSPLELKEREESDFLTIEEPKTVTATVLAVTSVPRPHSAPYKDHVMSLHLGDIDGSNEALVYIASMRDNVWTDAARLRIGDTVQIELKPWADFEDEYGSWNRSEFDDDELLLQDPCWGEIVKK